MQPGQLAQQILRLFFFVAPGNEKPQTQRRQLANRQILQFLDAGGNVLRRDNKIQFAIEQVINHPILAEFNGLSRHAVILVTKANQLVKNNRWVGIVDTDDDFPRAARGVMDFVINGRKALINGKQLLIQFLSGFIQTDVVIFAGKQRIADLILQCGNAFTERRCGHMYFFCRSGDVIGLRQQNEITHLFRDKNIHSVPLKIAMAYPHYGEKKDWMWGLIFTVAHRKNPAGKPGLQ